jgi:hypothetical protein
MADFSHNGIEDHETAAEAAARGERRAKFLRSQAFMLAAGLMFMNICLAVIVYLQGQNFQTNYQLQVAMQKETNQLLSQCNSRATDRTIEK